MTDYILIIATSRFHRFPGWLNEFHLFVCKLAGGNSLIELFLSLRSAIAQHLFCWKLLHVQILVQILCTRPLEMYPAIAISRTFRLRWPFARSCISNYFCPQTRTFIVTCAHNMIYHYVFEASIQSLQAIFPSWSHLPSSQDIHFHPLFSEITRPTVTVSYGVLNQLF